MDKAPPKGYQCHMSKAFEEQYRCLAELKDLDQKAHYVERDAEQIPEEIRKHDEALATRRQDLDSAKQQAAECEKKLRAAERELKEKEDSLFKAEGKMMEVKTNEEYQAAVKENQNQKQAKAVLEDRVLEMITEVEEQKQTLTGIEREFKDYEQGVLAQKKKLTDEHQDLMKQLEGLLRQRTTLTAQLEPAVATTYQKILSSGKGVAIALVDQGKCLACNIQIRPQLFNEILGYTAVHRCPSCGRILIAHRRPAAEETGEPLQAK